VYTPPVSLDDVVDYAICAVDGDIDGTTYTTKVAVTLALTKFGIPQKYYDKVLEEVRSVIFYDIEEGYQDWKEEAEEY